jgi:DNA-binding IclR family transcriptional regulator
MTVLGAFRPGDTALPLRVLAARTGLYKSTILRLLASLERHCCVKRNLDGSWSPGPMLLHWGSLYTRSLGLEALVPPVLESLTEATGQGATFWVKVDDDRRICLYRAAPPRTLRVAVQAGDLMPLGGAATGRVFSIWDPSMDDALELALRGADAVGLAGAALAGGGAGEAAGGRGRGGADARPGGLICRSDSGLRRRGP